MTEDIQRQNPAAPEHQARRARILIGLTGLTESEINGQEPPVSGSAFEATLPEPPPPGTIIPGEDCVYSLRGSADVISCIRMGLSRCPRAISPLFFVSGHEVRMSDAALRAFTPVLRRYCAKKLARALMPSANTYEHWLFIVALRALRLCRAALGQSSYEHWLFIVALRALRLCRAALGQSSSDLLP